MRPRPETGFPFSSNGVVPVVSGLDEERMGPFCVTTRLMSAEVEVVLGGTKRDDEILSVPPMAEAPPERAVRLAALCRNDWPVRVIVPPFDSMVTGKVIRPLREVRAAG